MSTRITTGKFAGINACADERGVIAALAVDHRGNLQQEIARARGEHGTASAADLSTFKTMITKVLTRYASAILLDPEYSIEALSSRAPGVGAMLAYEQSGYDSMVKGRLPDLLPEWSVRRLIAAGAQAIKILLFYNPSDDARINLIKHVYVERIGAECTALDVPFFLEPLAYDDAIGDVKGLAFARKKPAYVTHIMEEFSQPQYGVDVLKVEMPVNPAFVADTRAFVGGEAAYSRQEAIEHFRNAAHVATKPFIYLSGGTSDAVFCEMLALLAEAGVKYSGVLCGRAIWQDGIAIYANEGVEALELWLEDRGAQNIQAVNHLLAQGAAPWWDIYGGRNAIEIVDPGMLVR